jgi:hypothetical protein
VTFKLPQRAKTHFCDAAGNNLSIFCKEYMREPWQMGQARIKTDSQGRIG